MMYKWPPWMMGNFLETNHKCSKPRILSSSIMCHKVWLRDRSKHTVHSSSDRVKVGIQWQHREVHLRKKIHLRRTGTSWMNQWEIQITQLISSLQLRWINHHLLNSNNQRQLWMSMTRWYLLCKEAENQTNLQNTPQEKNIKEKNTRTVSLSLQISRVRHSHS